MSNLLAPQTNVEPPIWYFSSRRLMGHFVTVDFFWVISTLENPAVHSHRNRYSFHVYVCLLCLQSFRHLYYPRVYKNAWCTKIQSHTTQHLDQDASFHSARGKGVSPWSWDPLLVSHTVLFGMQLAIREQWDCLLRVQLQCRLRGKTLWGWNAILSESVYTLIQRPLCGTVSPTRRVRGRLNQEVDVGVISSAIIPSDLLGDFVLSIPSPLGSAWLGCPKGSTLLPPKTPSEDMAKCQLDTLCFLCLESSRQIEELPSYRGDCPAQQEEVRQLLHGRAGEWGLGRNRHETQVICLGTSWYSLAQRGLWMDERVNLSLKAQTPQEWGFRSCHWANHWDQQRQWLRLKGI